MTKERILVKDNNMHLYKVLFAGNEAIETTPVDPSDLPDIIIDRSTGKGELRWLSIYADTPEDSLIIANKVLTKYSSYFCNY